MSADASAPKILCVEDLQPMRETLASVLAHLPARVDVAADGDEAIDLLARADRNGHYSLIILDRHVPPAAGRPVDENFSTAAQSGIHTLFGLVPIIIYTAYPSYEHCVDSVRSGAIDYIPKIADSPTASMERLFVRCKSVLYPESGQLDPLASWLQVNVSRLIREYGGRTVAVVESDAARRAGVGTLIDRFAVISSESVDELRMTLQRHRLLGWSRIKFYSIPAAGDTIV